VLSLQKWSPYDMGRGQEGKKTTARGVKETALRIINSDL
jgi:hypothetical protein